ncbi:MAG: hypothetical protein AB1725_07450 [Armatimonadota bacterium]
MKAKEYFAYSSTSKADTLSRPVNKKLFDGRYASLAKRLDSWCAGTMAVEDAPRFIYSICLAPCLVFELLNRGNKKGPATYFERVIGHLLSGALGVAPVRQAWLPLRGLNRVSMTMDFLFDLGSTRRVHVAAKMSTRERIVQAWAHQVMLNKVFANPKYTGVLVLFSETKLDVKAKKVTEICVPDQWLAYQCLLTQMDRIFYLDPPKRYLDLAKEHPGVIPVQILPPTPKQIESALR